MRLFISYKSEDCNAVREIVEILISAGVPVWFAEYEVLPSQYDIFDRDLEANLHIAVRACTHALIFSNDRWSESDYCRVEMIAICALLPARNVIEVCIPHEDMPHRKYPILESGTMIEYSHNPITTARSILELFGINAAASIRPAIPSGKTMLRLWRFGLTLNPGGFEPTLEGSRRTSVGQGRPSAVLQAEIDGLTVKMAIILDVFDTVLRSLQISEKGAVSDRLVYKGYRQYAQKWEVEKSIEIRGLHLYFWDSRSQVALTYVTRSNDSRGLKGFWERRYVLSPRGMSPAERGEIHILFYVPELRGTDEEQLQRFVGLCRVFDRIVRTIQYQPLSARRDITNILPMIIVRIIYFTTCGWGANVLSSQPELSDWCILVAMVGGSMCAESLLVLYSCVYRQILWTLQTAPIEDSFDDTFSRLTTNVPYEIMSYPVVLIMPFVTDLVLTLSARRGRGTLLFPGPGLAWLVPIWFLLCTYGYTNLGLSWSILLAFMAGLVVGFMVVLRFICHRLHGVHWKDLVLS